MNASAQQYLAKNILKIKAAATNADMPSEIRKAVKPSTDPATLNVLARIYRSNPVRSAYPAAFNGIKSELGIETNEKEAVKKKRRLRAKDFQEAEAETSEESGSEELAKKTQILRDALKSSKVYDEHDSDRESEVGHSGDDESEDDDLDQYRGRLAFSDDDIGEASDIEDLERMLEMEGISRKSGRSRTSARTAASAMSISGDDSDAESVEPVPRQASLKKSSFVPSLTMGGYISGSGSDMEDEPVNVAPRKNRRGQRARQQIWEKKYGTGALHLQKQDRNQGWDAKRGATNGPTRGERKKLGRGGKPAGNSRGKGRGSESAKGTSAPKKPRRDDTGPLHPSWEAAKRAKEKKSEPVVFQGKKISFD